MSPIPTTTHTSRGFLRGIVEFKIFHFPIPQEMYLAGSALQRFITAVMVCSFRLIIFLFPPTISQICWAGHTITVTSDYFSQKTWIQKFLLTDRQQGPCPVSSLSAAAPSSCGALVQSFNSLKVIISMDGCKAQHSIAYSQLSTDTKTISTLH